MTRNEFVEAYRHELSGMVLDAATCNEHGAALSVRLRNIMRRIDAMLGKMHADLHPPQLADQAPSRPLNGAILPDRRAP